jgi:hypothetical protein
MIYGILSNTFVICRVYLLIGGEFPKTPKYNGLGEAFNFPLGLNNYNNDNNFTTQQCRSCLDHKWAVTIHLRIKEL